MKILSNIILDHNQVKQLGEADEPSDGVNLLRVNLLWDARYTAFHKLQKFDFSSAGVFNTETFEFTYPPPPSVILGNEVSIMTIRDTNNTALITAQNMVVTLPPSPGLWNARIRVIVLYWATFQGPAIQTLTFTPYNTNHTILNTYVFSNVTVNSVFELQFLSDLNQWFIIKIN